MAKVIDFEEWVERKSKCERNINCAFELVGSKAHSVVDFVMD